MNPDKPLTQEVKQATKQEITPETFPDEKYWERRKLIQKSDEEIIKSELKESAGFQDSNASEMRSAMMLDKRFFRKKRGTGKIFDIGCGKEGAYGATRVLGCNIGIDKVVLVEPFIKKEQMGSEYIDINKLEQEGRVEFVPKDGLSFLLSQKNESGNVMTGSIDIDVIPSYDYLERMAQEIYRVTPKNGYFISILSREIEEEAAQLFAEIKKFGHVTVFYKEKGEEAELEQDAKELLKKIETIMIEKKNTHLANELSILSNKLRDLIFGMNKERFRKIYGKDGAYGWEAVWEESDSFNKPAYGKQKQNIIESINYDLDDYLEDIDKKEDLVEAKSLFIEIKEFLKKYFGDDEEK